MMNYNTCNHNFKLNYDVKTHHEFNCLKCGKQLIKANTNYFKLYEKIFYDSIANYIANRSINFIQELYNTLSRIKKSNNLIYSKADIKIDTITNKAINFSKNDNYFFELNYRWHSSKSIVDVLNTINYDFVKMAIDVCNLFDKTTAYIDYCFDYNAEYKVLRNYIDDFSKIALNAKKHLND